MRRTLWYLVVILAITSISRPSNAEAAIITLDQWYEFEFGVTGGTFVTDTLPTCTGVIVCASPGDPSWTFFSADPVEVTIVDLQRSIDHFSLFDFGVLVGTTPVPTLDVQCFQDVAACLASTAHSEGVFALAPGNHSLTIRLENNSLLGKSAFQVEAASVPEPASMTLLLTGLAGAVARRRFRRSSRN